jgi:ferredoxin
MEWLTLAESALRAAQPRVPAVDPARCLGARHPSTACRACIEACPRSAVTRVPAARIDPRACDGCDACVAACPTGAIESPASAAAVDAWLAVLRPGHAALVRCARTPGVGPGALVLPCLGALRAADLVAACARGATGVRLEAGACGACPWSTASRRADAAVAVARAALALLGVCAFIWPIERPAAWGRAGEDPARPPDGVDGTRATCSNEPVPVADRQLSRRALFGLVRSGARRAATEVARETEGAAGRLERGGRVPRWRRRLDDDLRTLAARAASTVPLPTQLGLALPAAGSDCDGCGMCVVVCPFHALSVAGSAVACAAASCTACGVCVEACPSGVLVLLPALAGEPAAIGSAPAASGPSSPVHAERLAQRGTEADQQIRAAAAQRLLGATTGGSA